MNSTARESVNVYKTTNPPNGEQYEDQTIASWCHRMVQDRWPSQDKVDPNTSVNGNLDTLHEAIVVNNVKSLLVEKNLT